MTAGGEARTLHEALVLVADASSYEEDALRNAFDGLAHLFDVIEPGNRVVLKPNWLAHSHKYDEAEWVSVITNPAVITEVLRRVLERLDGRGHVSIADAPQTDSSWDGIMSRMTPDRWRDMGRAAGVTVEVIDLRDHEWRAAGRDAGITERIERPGDPRGKTICDLGVASEFVGHERSLVGYYGADYDASETNAAHNGTTHRYMVSRTVLEADVFINLPKLKTHKKAGITCSLKNLVGVNTYKNWLPHHSQGAPAQGGDAFPDSGVRQRAEGVLLPALKRAFVRWPAFARAFGPIKRIARPVFGDTRDTIRSGNWYGNDTLWRMVLDLNKVVLYANPDGSLRPDQLASRKRYISIVDGVVAGEGNGPEAPTPLHASRLVGGTNPVAVDVACARLMGFDWRRVPVLARAFQIRHFPLTAFTPDDIAVTHAARGHTVELDDLQPTPRPFRPHFGWVGHIEA